MRYNEKISENIENAPQLTVRNEEQTIIKWLLYSNAGDSLPHIAVPETLLETYLLILNKNCLFLVVDKISLWVNLSLIYTLLFNYMFFNLLIKEDLQSKGRLPS